MLGIASPDKPETLVKITGSLGVEDCASKYMNSFLARVTQSTYSLWRGSVHSIVPKSGALELGTLPDPPTRPCLLPNRLMLPPERSLSFRASLRRRARACCCFLL